MEKLNLQGRALLAPAFLYFTGLLLRHKHHADHAGTDMGADGGAKLGHPAAGQLEILVHVVVYRCNKLLIIAVEQRIAVARVNTAERVQLLEHGDQRTGAAAALVHQLDLAVLQGQHRLDAQRTAHNGNGGGQSSALLQMLEAVHHGNDAHPLLELFQHSGDLLRRQALLITQAHRLTDEQRLSLRSRFGVYDMRLQADIGGGQMRALVGAGQLLNTLTNSDIYAKDQLFATLDPTTRQLTLPNKQEIIITDTVGFIQRLPHQLIAAFRSTLEVVTEADLLVHVIDVSHELYKEQAAAVHEVLKEIGAETKPVITVYNKIDKLPPDSKLADRLALEEDTVCISAAKKLNLETLQQMIESHLKSKAVEVTLCIPYAETAKAAQLHETANVLEQEYTENGAVMKVILPVEDLEAYNEYILKSE